MERKHFELKNVNEHYEQKSYDKPLLFTGKKFEVLILPYNHGHPTTFMRNIETNEKFMEVVGGGCSSWGEKKSWSLQNVYSEYESLDRFYKLYSDGTMGFLKNSSVDHEFMTVKKLTEKDLQDIKYVPIPPSTVFEYILDNPQKGFIITVDRPEIHWGYDKFRVHIFTQNGAICENIKVENVARYRDGGTTEITTERGFLFCPTSFSKDKKHTWTPTGGEPIELRVISHEDNKPLIEKLQLRTGVNWPILRYEK